jgi:hypothetical protein
MRITDEIAKLHGNTRETTPWLIWIDSVIALARCSVEQLEPHRERMLRAYQNGEAVWMAASALELCVQQRAIGERADREASGLARMVRRRGC